jgi:hypothetical protein
MNIQLSLSHYAQLLDPAPAWSRVRAACELWWPARQVFLLGRPVINGADGRRASADETLPVRMPSCRPLLPGLCTTGAAHYCAERPDKRKPC